MDVETPVKTRPLRPEDVPRLMQWLPQEPLMRRYQLDDEVLELALRTALPTGDILRTADAPGAPCCALAWTQPWAGLGRGAYLRLICVQPDRQGQGLGQALLEACEEASRARGQENLMLLVSDYNARAQTFYRRCGYVQAGVLTDYILPGVDELLFWKLL